MSFASQVIKFQRAIVPPTDPILAQNESGDVVFFIGDDANGAKEAILKLMGTAYRLYATCEQGADGKLMITENHGSEILF